MIFIHIVVFDAQILVLLSLKHKLTITL